MDRIHKLTVAAIVALTLVSTAMLVQHEIIRQKQIEMQGDRKEAFIKKYKLKIAKNAKIYKDVTALLEEKKLSEAMTQLEKVMEENPDNPQSLVYKAQIQTAFGKLAEPIHTYRQAVLAEPDYIDKKTPLFIGHQIMKLILEARGKLNRELKLKPGDRLIRIAIEDIYYLQRRLAGGCE